MHASKENAEKAYDILDANRHAFSREEWSFLFDFCDAAKRKLPSEAAFERDRKRSKKLV